MNTDKEPHPVRPKSDAGGNQSWLRQKVMHGSAVAMAASGVYLVSRIVLTPVILAHVTLAEYGLWSFCFVILSYAGISAFGVNNAYVKYTAEHFSNNDIARINQLLSTGLVSMGLAAVALFVALYASAPYLVSLFHIEPELADVAAFMLVGTASVFLLDIALGGFRSLLEGMQEVALGKMVWLAATLVETALVLVFLLQGAGIRGVLYAFIIKTLIEVALNVVLAFRRLPGLRLGLGLVRKQAMHELFVFGGKLQVLGLLGIFMGSFDRVVTTRLLGLEATGLYEVGRKFPFTARSVGGAALAPFLPAASYLGGEWRDSPRLSLNEKLKKYGALCLVSLVGSGALAVPMFWYLWRESGYALYSIYPWAALILVLLLIFPGVRAMGRVRGLLGKGEYIEGEELRTLYLRGCRYMNLLNAVMYAFLAAIAPQLIFAWVGKGYEETYAICVVVVFMHMIHMATGPASSVVRGINRAGRELEAVLINLVLMVAWTPLLAWKGGLMGAVWGVTLSTIIGSIYFVWRTNLAFRISGMEYLRTAILPGIHFFLVAAVVWAVFRALPDLGRWETLGALCVAGVLYLAACILLLRFRILDSGEWRLLAAPVLRRLGRMKPD